MTGNVFINWDYNFFLQLGTDTKKAATRATNFLGSRVEIRTPIDWTKTSCPTIRRPGSINTMISNSASEIQSLGIFDKSVIVNSSATTWKEVFSDVSTGAVLY